MVEKRKRGRPRKIQPVAAVDHVVPNTETLVVRVDPPEEPIVVERVRSLPDADPITASEETIKQLYKETSRQQLYDMVLLFLEGGADVNVRSANGQTPLTLAVKMGYTELVQLLAHTYRADSGLQDNDGKTALDHARERGFEDIVALLGG